VPRNQNGANDNRRNDASYGESADKDSANTNLVDFLVKSLVTRGIKQYQAERLLSGKTEEILGKIKEIIHYFDNLCHNRSALVSRSPVGFLYRAVERCESFVLPREKNSSFSNPGRNNFKQQKLFFHESAEEKRAEEKKSHSLKNFNRDSSLEATYLVERKKLLNKLKSEVQPELLAKLKADVEKGLAKIKPLLSSETHYLQALNHGIESKLEKLFSLPTFEEWLSEGKKRSQN
jgi:hypothetical protein